MVITCIICGQDGKNKHEMMTCDNAECDRSFHTACLGRYHKPDTEWFCPKCFVDQNTPCIVCKESHFRHLMLYCKNKACRNAFHIYCSPTKITDIPENGVDCPVCIKKRRTYQCRLFFEVFSYATVIALILLAAGK